MAGPDSAACRRRRRAQPLPARAQATPLCRRALLYGRGMPDHGSPAVETQPLDSARVLTLTKFSVRRAAVGGLVFDRAEFQPGWRWSQHARDPTGPASCQEPHVGLLLSGALGVLMDDGTRHEIHTGTVYSIPPGHDTWTLGDEPCVAIDVALTDPMLKT